MEYSFERLNKWAYDTNDVLLDQDEDLMLHDPVYVPLLLGFISDDSCPKNLYCKNILEYYIQELFLFKQVESIEIIKEYFNDMSENWRVEKLINKFKFLYCCLNDKREINDLEADKIAFELINGECGFRDFSRTGKIMRNYIEYIGSTSSYKIYFYINPMNSNWLYSKYYPLAEKELF
ncbi:MAG: hypothetical protein ACM3UU_11755 [Ignavibacteriales bacterium]